MKTTYKVAIAGYGNLGRGVELAIKQNPDFELAAVFTRRAPETVSLKTAGVPVVRFEDMHAYKGKIDAVLLCGGSARDVPEQAPEILKHFHCIDSFDTHNKIPDYLKKVDGIGKANGTLSLISVGWDPGLFSIARLYFNALLPEGVTNTFWGKGVSQGHSDAIRGISGVKNGIQYTIPQAAAVEDARAGKTLSTRERHLRECFVVADEKDHVRIEKTIKEMPDYFADYDTIVHFISDAEFKKNHTAMPHGGTVLRSGKSAADKSSVLELGIKLESNPEFTASVMVAYARAVLRFAAEGKTGALTVFDIAPAYLFAEGRDAAIKQLL